MLIAFSAFVANQVWDVEISGALLFCLVDLDVFI